MTTARVMIVPGTIAIGQVDYSKEDLYLTCNLTTSSVSFYRYSVDTLSFGLDTEKNLVYLNAYTNYRKWTKSKLEVPPPRFKGNIKLLADYDDNGIASGPKNLELNYTYNNESSALCVDFVHEQTPPLVGVRISNNLVLEIDSSGGIARIWLESLQVSDI